MGRKYGGEVMLADTLSRYWWITLFRGVLWILFGIFMFLQPGISILALTLTFGAFALVDGIVSVVSAIGGRETNESWWILLIRGLAAFCVGLLTLFTPQMTAVALLVWIAVWAIATGLLEIVAAIRLRKEIQDEFGLALAGLVSVAFGVFVLARPGIGALAVLWAIAVYALTFGMVLVSMAFETRRFVRRVKG
jgi:uncharacterized membrane protein HdeD (DUF308 family)